MFLSFVIKIDTCSGIGNIVISPFSPDSCSNLLAWDCFSKAGESFRGNDFHSAKLLYRDAAECYSKIQGCDSLYLCALLGEGMSYYKLNELESARLNYLQIIEINKVKLKLSQAYLASVYHNLGLIYQKQFDLQSALDYQGKSLTIKKNSLSDFDARGNSWNNLGALYEQLASTSEANECYEKALACFLKGGDKEKLLSVYLNLARLKQQLGNTEEAGMYLDAAILKADSAAGLSTSLKRELLFSLAVKHYQQRKYKTALDNCQGIKELVNTAEPAQMIRELSLYACCQEKLSNIKEAEDAFSIKVDYDRANGNELSAWGAHLMAKALFYQRIGKTAEAIMNLKESIDIFDETFGSAATAVIYARMQLADVFYQSGKYAECFEESSDVLVLTKSAAMTQYPPLIIDLMELKALSAYALYSENPGNIELLSLSAELYIEMARIISTERLLLPEWSSLEWGDNYRLLFENGLKISYMAFRLDEASGTSQVREMMMLNRALVLRKQLSDNDLFSSLPAEDRELASFKDEDRENVHRRFLIGLEMAKPTPDFLNIAKLEEKFLHSHLRLDSLKSVLQSRYPQVFSAILPSETNKKGLNLQIDSITCMVEYFLGDDMIFALITNHKSEKILAWKKESILNIKIKAYLKDLKMLGFETYISNGREVFRLIFEPLMNELSAYKRLVIIPDAECWALPFDALILPANSADNLDIPHYLIEKFIISFAYSGIANCNNGKNSGSVNRIQVFAPDNSLVFSQKEAETIKSMAVERGIPCESYTGSGCSSSAFLRCLSGNSALHLSTHARSDSKHPALAALEFSPDDELFEGEIYSNISSLRLLVLNACETQKGITASSEGMLSLSRAFLSCGVKNVIAGLFRVQDEQAYKLISDFYSAMFSGKDYSEALCAAKLKALKNPETAFPRNWAAWVHIQP